MRHDERAAVSGAERRAAAASPSNRQRRDLAPHPSTTSPVEPRGTAPPDIARGQEGTMLRRSLTIACLLCLAAPLGASASSSAQPEYGPAKGPYGPTVIGHLPRLIKAKGPYGPTVAGHLPRLTKAKGPYGPTVAGQLPAPTKATGPYEITSRTVSQVATKSTTHGAVQMDRWRTAAIVEAALLILGSAALVASRRMPRVG